MKRYINSTKKEFESLSELEIMSKADVIIDADLPEKWVSEFK